MSQEHSSERSKTCSPVSATEAVNVRDSWDVLDTPRSAQSDSDYKEPKVTLKAASKDEKGVNSTEVLSQVELRILVNESKEKTSKSGQKEVLSTRQHARRSRANKTENKNNRPSSAKRNNSRNRPASAKIHSSDIRHDKPRRPLSAGILRPSTPDTTSRTVIPRRYRKLQLKSHEQMLQEEYSALRHLLKDKENMSRDELREQHIEQTRSMICKYL